MIQECMRGKNGTAMLPLVCHNWISKVCWHSLRTSCVMPAWGLLYCVFHMPRFSEIVPVTMTNFQILAAQFPSHHARLLGPPKESQALLCDLSVILAHSFLGYLPRLPQLMARLSVLRLTLSHWFIWHSVWPWLFLVPWWASLQAGSELAPGSLNVRGSGFGITWCGKPTSA